MFNLMLILTLLFLPHIGAQNSSTQQVGPESGSLVIVGGGALSKSIYQRVIDLAGGSSGPIVVIPTAGGNKTYDNNFPDAQKFRELGATNVSVLHTTDPKMADSDQFVQPLLSAKAVWFGGGRQWRLVDVYGKTASEKAFRSVLDRGGVIGGSSAGASIQGSFLARGDTANNKLIIGNHQEGFGYINAAIDQHVLVRNRHFDMLNMVNSRPGLLGISLDENTAIVVNKNVAEVVGDSYAIMYDGKYFSREGDNPNPLPGKSSLFYFLRKGDKYDLGKRQVIVPKS